MATHDSEMTECLDDNQIVEFIDGLLSARDVARVERHAARCDPCRRLLAELGRAPTEEPLMQGLSATLPAGGEAHIDIQPGQEIGRFVVLDKVGRGGMGVVFSAYDPKLDRKVAIKLLHSRPEGALQTPQDSQMRLLREAQAMAQLSHPNVISVYDVGTYKSEVYIAMEFVEGETLSKWLLRWDRSWQEILDKFVQAGKALGDAHAASLVHRDFKPDNVLIGHDNRVRVMDFGLARWTLSESSKKPADHALEPPPYVRDEARQEARDEKARDDEASDDEARDDEARHDILDDGHQDDAADGYDGLGRNALDHSLTKTGALLGTPRYMAPEQFTGTTADARSDQFSFCVALYEALYQQHPFEKKTSYGLIEAPETTTIRPPPQGSKVPGWLQAALLRGMSADPHERFPSMGALLRSLAYVSKPSSHRFVFLVGAAVISLLAAVYFYNQSDNRSEELALAQFQSHELAERLDTLSDEIEGLQAKLNDTRDKLTEARERGDDAEQVIEKLEHELREAVVQLEETRVELEKTQEQLVEARRNIDKLRRRPQQTRVVGLSNTDIEAQINRNYREFATCFREWSERERRTGQLFAVRFQVDARGIPQRGSKTGGIDDKVIYDCVVGLLENELRFPRREGTTIAELGFRYDDDGLRYSVKIRDVVEDVMVVPATE